MSTRNIIPRSNGEGSLGTETKRWGSGHFAEDLKRGGIQTAVEFLGIPTIYKRFELTRNESGKVTAVYYFDNNDNNIATVSIIYNNGKPVSASHGNKTITFTYDGAGKISGGTLS